MAARALPRLGADSWSNVRACSRVIGEAANKIVKVAPEYVAEHNEVPWNLMRAVRNKIIHDYFEVDYGVVWQPRSKRCRRNNPGSLADVRFYASAGLIER